jgi:hypothetical protein
LLILQPCWRPVIGRWFFLLQVKSPPLSPSWLGAC